MLCANTVSFIGLFCKRDLSFYMRMNRVAYTWDVETQKGCTQGTHTRDAHTQEMHTHLCVHPLCASLVCVHPLCVRIPCVCASLVCVHPLCVCIPCVCASLVCVHLLCVSQWIYIGICKCDENESCHVRMCLHRSIASCSHPIHRLLKSSGLFCRILSVL